MTSLWIPLGCLWGQTCSASPWRSKTTERCNMFCFGWVFADAIWRQFWYSHMLERYQNKLRSDKKKQMLFLRLKILLMPLSIQQIKDEREFHKVTLRDWQCCFTVILFVFHELWNFNKHFFLLSVKTHTFLLAYICFYPISVVVGVYLKLRLWLPRSKLSHLYVATQVFRPVFGIYVPKRVNCKRVESLTNQELEFVSELASLLIYKSSRRQRLVRVVVSHAF